MSERDIFVAALQINDAAERRAYLDEACRTDGALRQHIEGLLAAHENAGSFLEPSPQTQLADAGSPMLECPGLVIGPYKLLQQIGEGGMGVVWMAEQTQPMRRKVALKVIKPGMDSRQVIARFEAERQALAMMDHVNIARVLDAGTTAAGLPYFVMELVHGVPITKYCDDCHLTPRQRLELFVPVCQAIQHAHQKGIIHRDIKPSNVMVTLYDGKAVPKVIDFGVAKATEQHLTERTLFTQYGSMVGTLEYMSPEQAEMSALGADTRSDIFSLGVLLYELLTGSTPLSHKRVREAAYGEVLRMIKEEEPPRPSTRLSNSGGALASISAQRQMEPAKLTKLVRGELDWIVMKTLEKERSRRYETASAFAADLQRYLNDEPVLACPPSAGYRLRKLVRRNKGLLATAVVVVLALLAGTAVSTWQAIRAGQAEGLAENRLKTTNANFLAAEKAENEATRRLYDARLAQARAGSLSRRVGQRLDSLDAVAEAAKVARGLNLPEERLLELRNAAIACLALTDLRRGKPCGNWPAGSNHFDFDGKLERYARVDLQGAVSVRRVKDDEEIARLPGSGSETWPLLSRDGKFLSVRSASGMSLWNLGGREPVQLVHQPANDSFGIDFSLDSQQCAIGHADGSISLYDLAAKQPPRQLPAGRRANFLAFHPEGKQLAVSSNTGVEIRNLVTGKVVLDLQPLAQAFHLAWHPNGKSLAVACIGSGIHLWDVAAGKESMVLGNLRNNGVTLAFNPDGDLLAGTGWDGMLRLWDPRTGKQLFSTPATMPGHSPRFSFDNRLLAAHAGDGKLWLWEISACSEYRTLVRAAHAGQGAYMTTAIGSDERLLAVGMPDGVGLWDLPSGKELAFLESPGSVCAVFEPSGALLTNGTAGLLRWPVQAAPATPGLLRIGPPHKLSVPGPICHVACSRDGAVIGISQFQGGRVLHASRPDQPVRLNPREGHDDARYVAVSPDGQRVVTGSHTRSGVKIWDARSGQLEKELRDDGHRVGFSPDGKLLATIGGSGLRLWAAGSWLEGPQIGGLAFAFSPDGKLLAVETSSGAIRLVNPNTGREYARLQDPNQDRAWFMTFSGDSTQLVASNGDSHSIQVWDLRAIRHQLAALGLDWGLPVYAPPKLDSRKPLQVQVERGNLDALIQAQEHSRQGRGYVKARQWVRSIAAYSKAVEADPRDAGSLNELAWLLAACPDAAFREPARAVELAGRACKLTPGDGNACNTLGVAHYRAGEWQAAAEALAKSMELLGGEEVSCNAFFLAMTHWQLGNKAEARKSYGQAVDWMDKNKPRNEELSRFRAEASALLEVKEKKD